MSAIFQVSEVLAGSFWPTCFEKTLAKKEQILLYVHQSSISTIIVQIRQKRIKLEHIVYCLKNSAGIKYFFQLKRIMHASLCDITLEYTL